jgi:parallel beta-helix repeat protein
VIDGFAIGIRDNASGAVISGPGLLVAANRIDGVLVYHTTASMVRRVSVRGNTDYGLHVQASGSAVLLNNQVAGSKIYGIWAQASGGTQISDNVVGGSGTAGIYLGCSGTANLQNLSCGRPTDKSEVNKNTLTHDGDYGIAVADASIGNIIQANQATGDTVDDLYDENPHCSWSSGTNSWMNNSGTANQSVSTTCIG